MTRPPLRGLRLIGPSPNRMGTARLLSPSSECLSERAGAEAPFLPSPLPSSLGRLSRLVSSGDGAFANLTNSKEMRMRTTYRALQNASYPFRVEVLTLEPASAHMPKMLVDWRTPSHIHISKPFTLKRQPCTKYLKNLILPDKPTVGETGAESGMHVGKLALRCLSVFID